MFESVRAWEKLLINIKNEFIEKKNQLYQMEFYVLIYIFSIVYLKLRNLCIFCITFLFAFMFV